MPTVLITHDVDDVDHWLSSPKREEIFGPMGITVRTFRDPEGSSRVGLLCEIPDLDAWRAVIESDAGAEAMQTDGVHPDTLLLLLEG